MILKDIHNYQKRRKSFDTSNTTTTTSKQSDLAVVKERIKSQKQVYERLDKQLSDSERQKIEVNEKSNCLIQMK